MAKRTKDRTGAQYHPGHVSRLLHSLGFSCQRPTRRAIERNEADIAEWKRFEWPLLEKARREGRTIVFIDEGGLSTRPHWVRTWAPRR